MTYHDLTSATTATSIFSPIFQVIYWKSNLFSTRKMQSFSFLNLTVLSKLLLIRRALTKAFLCVIQLIFKENTWLDACKHTG